MIESVCVFCGSHKGAQPEYMAAARHLGKCLAEQNLQLVFGGGRVGLMGVIADAVLAEGGQVTGVIPEQLADRELAHRELTNLHVVTGMHQRKQLMADLSDAFIAMPGGMGTLEELFEVLTWSQLGIHAKPSGVLNVLGYYDGLMSFLDHQSSEGFLKPEHRQLLHASDNPQELLQQLKA